MLPGDFPMNLYRGDTSRWQFKLWTDTTKTQPADLSGATATAQIRDKAGGEAITDLACAITQPNIIDVSLSAGQSQLLPAKGAWDLQLTYPSGDVVTVLAGKVAVTSDITREGAAVARLRAVR